MAASSSRERILGDISRALKSEARSESLSPGAPSSLKEDARVAAEIRRRCDSNRPGLIEQFESELARIGARVHHAASYESAAEYIEQIASQRSATTVIAWNTEGVDAIGIQNRLARAGIAYVTEATNASFIRIASEAAVGVSGVDYALADTGTLVLLAREGQSRSVSLLPPVHIAIVKPEQIVSGLDDFFPLLRQEHGSRMSSAVTFITGPSRTADIELTLVIGVHGPQELHIVLLTN